MAKIPRAQVTEAYVLGLMAELRPRLATTLKAFTAASERTLGLEAETQRLTAKLQASLTARKQQEAVQAQQLLQLRELKVKIAKLHQENLLLKRRANELQQEVKALESAAAAVTAEDAAAALGRREGRKERAENLGRAVSQRQLERQRGRLLVDIQKNEQLLGQLQQQSTSLYEAQSKAGRALRILQDQEQASIQELEHLQVKFIKPALYLSRFKEQLAYANCLFYLEKEVKTWRAAVKEALLGFRELQQAVKGGKYRLDKHSELLGGRGLAAVWALYAAVAINELALARELFRLLVDPKLFFHHIFNVRRVWYLGLYLYTLQERNQGQRALEGQAGGLAVPPKVAVAATTRLKHLLQIHQYTRAGAGAYSRAFKSLVVGDNPAFLEAVQALLLYERAEAYQATDLTWAGVGVVNFPVLALVGLAGRQGLVHLDEVRAFLPTADWWSLFSP